MGCSRSREAVSSSASSEASQSSWRSYRPPSSLDSLQGQSVPESAAAAVQGQAQGLVEMSKVAGEERDHVCCHRQHLYFRTLAACTPGLGSY